MQGVIKRPRRRSETYAAQGSDDHNAADAPFQKWRVVVDGRRTLQPLEIQLLIKIYHKRSMGSLISLDLPIDTTQPYKKGALSKQR